MALDSAGPKEWPLENRDSESQPLLPRMTSRPTLVTRKRLLLSATYAYVIWLLSRVPWFKVHTGYHSEQLKVGTYNIRYDPSPSIERPQATWGLEVSWNERRVPLADQVLWEMPDIIGFQEVLHHQLLDLDELLGSHYDYVGVGRDDGEEAGEAVPLFWKRTMFDRIGEPEYFWLSKTPDVPGSISWDAGQTRMVTLVHLRIRSSGERVHAICTHFDDAGIVSRAKASAVILDRLKSLLGGHELVLLVGDLNSEAHEDGYQILTGRRYNVSSSVARVSFIDAQREVLDQKVGGQASASVPRLHDIYGHRGTFTNFKPPGQEEHKIIDFVMIADNQAALRWKVKQAAVLPNLFGPATPRLSDHRPVLAVFERLV